MHQGGCGSTHKETETEKAIKSPLTDEEKEVPAGYLRLSRSTRKYLFSVHSRLN